MDERERENEQLHVCEACGAKSDSPIAVTDSRGRFVCDVCHRADAKDYHDKILEAMAKDKAMPRRKLPRC